jgi:hypothetical protein
MTLLNMDHGLTRISTDQRSCIIRVDPCNPWLPFLDINKGRD